MLPILSESTSSGKQYVVRFGGLNLGEGWSDGELSECKNLSSMRYPCVSQRFGRVLYSIYGSGGDGGDADGGTVAVPDYEILAIAAKNGMITITTNVIWHDTGDEMLATACVPALSAGRKHIAAVGDYVIIFPDKVYYNAATHEMGQMELTYTLDNSTVTFTDSTITAEADDVFPFRVGDAITINSGIPENDKTVIIRGVDGNVLTFYDDTFSAAKTTAVVTFTREVPDMDVICESGNRLWGAKGQTIYGSKYGDPLNFNVFDGLSSDSYAIEVGTEGEFTGAASYGAHVCFFKEHHLHKLYGTQPSTYQVTTSQVHGVQKGSERSLVNINETLYYKGTNGVYAYTGSVPQLISECFGAARFSRACAASDGDRYYISMMDGKGQWSLLVYDVLRGIWLREDDLQCIDMTLAGGFIYMLTSEGELWKMDPEASKEGLEWSMTFCPFNETVNERKGYSKFHLRLDLAEGAWLKLEVKRDNDTRWKEVYKTHNTKARTITVPVLPERCDSVEIRISGKGECVLRTFVREFFVGSDV